MKVQKKKSRHKDLSPQSRIGSQSKHPNYLLCLRVENVHHLRFYFFLFFPPQISPVSSFKTDHNTLNGGLGTRAYRSCTLHTAATRAIVSDTGEQPVCGFRQLEDQRQGNYGAHAYFLCSLCYSHPGRPCSHLHRLILSPFPLSKIHGCLNWWGGIFFFCVFRICRFFLNGKMCSFV